MATKMKSILVNVTKTGIKKGEPEDGAYCPIARALKGKGLKDVFVDHEGVSFTFNHVIYTVNLPEVAKKFVKAFDRYKKVNPFKFILEWKLEKN